MMRKFVVVVMAALVLCGALFAAEDAGTLPVNDGAVAVADSADAASASDWKALAVSWLDTIVKAVASALGLALLWLVKKIFADYRERQVFSEAVTALEEGWSVAQEEFVTWAKRAKEDGKLTKEEREQARDLAYEHAKRVASGPAKDLLVEWGKDKVMSLLGKITGKSKAVKVEVTAPEACDGPELAEGDGPCSSVSPIPH